MFVEVQYAPHPRSTGASVKNPESFTVVVHLIYLSSRSPRATATSTTVDGANSLWPHYLYGGRYRTFTLPRTPATPGNQSPSRTSALPVRVRVQSAGLLFRVTVGLIIIALGLGLPSQNRVITWPVISRAVEARCKLLYSLYFARIRVRVRYGGADVRGTKSPTFYRLASCPWPETKTSLPWRKILGGRVRT